MSIEQYQPRGPEITKEDGRFAVAFLPDLHPSIDVMLAIEQDGETFLARVDAILGGNKVRLDLLNRTPAIGAIVPSILSWSPAFERTHAASNARWSEEGIAWKRDDASTPSKRVRPLDETLDLCAPFVDGGLNLAFSSAQLHPTFFSPTQICNDQLANGFHNDAACGWEVFSKTLPDGEDALIFTHYSNDLDRRLDAFRDNGGTRLFIVQVPDDIFPIVESFSFGEPDAVWIADDLGRVDLLRSSSSLEDPIVIERRSEMHLAHQELEFAALAGEETDAVLAHWSRPLFDPTE